MRSFRLIAAASALAAFSLFTVAGGGAARAQTPAAPPASASPPAVAPASAPLAKPRTWLVENHDRLVSVREKDGLPLFAQVITTPNVTVEVNFVHAKKSITLTLKDAKNKRLYEMTFPHVEHGSFKANFSAYGKDSSTLDGGTSFTIISDADAAEERTDDDGKLVLVIGSDNLLLDGNLTSGTDRTHFERHGTQLTMTRFENGKQVEEAAATVNTDKGTMVATHNGEEVASFLGGENKTVRIRDEKGEVTSRAIKQDGKDYTEFTIGDRKILVEGGNWHFELKDGVMTLSPSPDNTQPAKTAPVTTAANK